MPKNKTSNSNANFESNGKLYETWLFVLLLIKGYSTGLPFHIGKEVKIADKFDDVVLRHKTCNPEDNTSKWNYIFCQVKLVDDGKDKVLDKDVLLGKRQISFNIEDFDLKKYFKSYLKIKEQFRNSENVLSKLVIYSNVSDLHENLKSINEDVDEYDQVLSAKEKTTRCSFNTDSTDGKHIVRKLQKVDTDWKELLNILYKCTDEKYDSKNPMKNEGVLQYYQNALVEQKILTVYNEEEKITVKSSSTDKKSTKKEKTKTVTVTKCRFHEDFLNGKCTNSVKQIFDELFNKWSPEKVQALKEKSWKVWRTFGVKPKENTTSIVQLPTIQSVSEGDVLDFLKILEFKVGEPNLGELSEVTKDQFEISKLFGLSEAAEYIWSKTENYIKDWRKENLQAEGWITDKDKLFGDLKTHISKIDAQKISCDHIKYYEKLISQYDVHFKNKLTDYIGSPEEKLDTTIIFSKETFITVLKVVDTLNEFSRQFLYFDADDVIANPNCNEVLSLIKENANKNIIVLNWKEGWAVDKLKGIIEELKDKTQLIVITNNSSLTFENCSRVEDHKIYIDDMKSKGKVLEIPIDCQGEKVPLKTVLPSDQNSSLNEIVSPQMLKALILGKSNFFNSTSLNETDVTYIPRKFVPSVFNDDILKRSQSKKNEMFLISGAIDETKKKQWLKDYPGKIEFLKGDIIDQLQKIKEKNKSKNIHWFEYKSNLFIWKTTFGSLAFLIDVKENLKENQNVYLEERTLTQFSNHLQIITGVAGLGKTSSVNYIKKLYLQKHPSSFVVSVKLNEQQETLSKLRDRSIKEPEDFVCKLLTEEDPFRKQLIKYGIKNQNGTLLLFDGYDEIQSEESRNLFRNYLSRLNGMKNVNIVITSRPNVVNELEKEHNVLSTTLQQFTEENQKSFLEDRITNKVSSKSIEEKSKYVEKILELVRKKINNKEYSLVGIPLILKMISEIFIDNCDDLEIDQLPKEFDLKKLYEYFTKAMYQRYFEEKESTNMEFVKRFQPNGYKTYYYYHQVLSIYSLLHQQIESVNNVFPEILKPNQLEIQNNVCNKGIVTHINGDETKFIHQTFAEYFFATFIFNNCTQTNCNPKLIEFLLSKVLCDEYFQNVRIFLNSLFSSETKTNYFNEHKQYLKSPSKIQLTTVEIFFHIIYNSVLENNDNIFKIFFKFYNDDTLKVCKITNSKLGFLCTKMLFAAVQNNNIDVTKCLFENGIKKNSKNEFTETAIHVAAKYGNYEVLKTLIEYGLSINQHDNLGRTPLYVAAQNGHIKVVKFLKESCADVNACDKDNVTPLYIAAQEGHIEVVKFLKESGADVNACTKDNATPLHVAAHNGHIEVVKFLKESGADVNACNTNNATPLHVAAQNGQIEVVKFLKESGADVNACNTNNATPLHVAAQNGQIEVVKFLKESGADVNACNTNNATPLHVAAQNGQIEVVKFLKESGADVNACNTNNATPLHVAAQNGQIEVVKFLKESGADVNACNTNNATPLHVAAQNGQIEVVKFLKESGADVNACNTNNATPLHVAAQNGQIEVVKFLKESGADVNACNTNNATPLHVVAQNGQIEVVKFLKESGADVNACNTNNATPLHVAAQNGQIEVVKFLKESCADVNACTKDNATPLYIAAQEGHIEVVKFLKESGADVNACNTNNATPLHVAAQNGQIEVVKFLKESGADVNACNTNNATPLHVVAQNGQIEVVKFLKESGADVNACNTNNATPLHVAAQNGQIEVVKFLKESGADVNACNTNNATPLHVAAQNGQIEVVKFLKESGADVNACNTNNATPLHVAAQNGQIEVVKFLKESCADVNACTKDNATPLYIAAQEGHIEVVKFLKESGADVNACNTNNATPLHVAAHNDHIEVVKFLKESCADVNACTKDNATPLYIAAQEGHIEVVKFLKESGADVNACDKDNFTPLYVAAQEGHIEVVKFLKESGADVNACNTNNATPLHVAAQNGQIEVVKFLKESGADVNACDKDNFTPLYVAAQEGHIEVVKFLKESGADVNACNTNNATPLHVAAQNGQIEVVKFLKESGADVNACDKDNFTPLYVAAQEGHIEVVKFLKESGADVNACNTNNATPLHVAAQEGQIEVVKFLKESGADVNACDKDNFTPLYVAAQEGHIKVVKFLKESGADVNACTKDNATPLYIAAQEGHIEVVKFLKQSGADVNACGGNNCTPLEIAAYNGHIDVVKFLKECGADVNACDNDNDTPLHEAARNGHVKVVQFLKESGADVNAYNKDNFTPLHIAEINGHIEVIKILKAA